DLWSATEGEDLGAMRAASDRLHPVVRGIYGAPPRMDMHTRIKVALQHLGVQRLAVATPYEAAVNERTQAFLGESGFTVLGVKGLGMRKAVDMSNVLPETSYRLARAVVEENPGAEAVYFPCARWPVIDNIARLEAELGIPVVTSVQSMLWAALKGFEWWEPVVGYGRLLEGLSRNGHNRA
ncbi:MAG: hypothetical protein QGH72_07590, partial [Dehalococcoidia bacterium]|nr:hypothetical protein [Dehalococcoidia bacterium]